MAEHGLLGTFKAVVTDTVARVEVGDTMCPYCNGARPVRKGYPRCYYCQAAYEYIFEGAPRPRFYRTKRASDD